MQAAMRTTGCGPHTAPCSSNLGLRQGSLVSVRMPTKPFCHPSEPLVEQWQPACVVCAAYPSARTTLGRMPRHGVVVRMLPPQTPQEPISAQGISVQSVTTALLHASRAWDKYDCDKSGNLSLKEAADLLNSHELQDAALLLTNVAPTKWKEDDLKPLFAKADADKSGALSRTEFLAMYVQVTTQRVQRNPLVLAEALMGFLDVDRNGKIEGKELKVLLTLIGFPIAMMLPIPSNIGVDYRSILRSLPGGNNNV